MSGSLRKGILYEITPHSIVVFNGYSAWPKYGTFIGFAPSNKHPVFQFGNDFVAISPETHTIEALK